jgi:predicted chitinase
MASFVDKLTPEQKKRATLIAGELKKLGITNKYVVAGILAVVSKESNFNRLKEASYANTDNGRIKAIFGSRVSALSDSQLTALKKDYNKFFEAVYGGAWGAKSLGNDKAGDGAKYVGRGYNQLTGKGNYKLIGSKIGVDLVNSPQLLETPEVAAKAIASYFKTNIDRLIKNGTFEARYLLNDVEKVKDEKTGVNIAYDINAGSAKQKYGDTTGGYQTSVSRVGDFVDSIAEFVTTNPVKTGGGLILLGLLSAGAYYLSKGGFTKIVG